MALHPRIPASSVLVALALVGCKKDEPAPLPSDRYEQTHLPTAGEVTTPVGDTHVRAFGRPVSPFPPELAAKVTAERCAREIRCSNIGPGKKYADLNACMADLGLKTKSKLDTYEC